MKKWNSRKLVAFAVVFFVSTISLYFNKLSGEQWVFSTQWLFSIFVFGNVLPKVWNKRKRYIKKVVCNQQKDA